MKKIFKYGPFVILFLIPLLVYQRVNTSSWVSSSDVHALLEFASSLVAITAGIMVLLHFITTGRLFFLIISIGFILVGAEEFIHTIFSFTRIWAVSLPNPRLYISATWLTGSFLLVISFFIAVILKNKEIVKEKRSLYAAVCNVAAFIFSVFITWVIIHSSFLPSFVQVGQIYKQLIELFLSVLFFVAFIFYLNLYFKQPSRSPLLWSIIACIIFMALTHFFIIKAQTLYDVHWDIAHVAKLLSYFFPIFGVWGETILLYRNSEAQFKELGVESNKRRGAEEEIKKLNEDLERRIKQRTAQLEIANKELEAFSYSVSHDLRAPLRGMDGFSKALLDDYSDKLDDTGKGYLNRVRAATKNMSELIDDMLELSRISREDMVFKTVNLSRIADEIMAGLKEQEPERQVDFSVQAGLIAWGDAHLFEIALQNLLGNAWKFTGKQRLAKIEFGKMKFEGQDSYFIRDDGVGFDTAYYDKLFNPFQRLHSEKEFPGTGIGLVTVRRIIERHGGRVWAESKVGKGATFYFTLNEKKEAL